MISRRACLVIEPRPTYYTTHQYPIRMDNLVRVPIPVTMPVGVQPITELRNASAHLEPHSQAGSKKRNKPLMEKRRRQRINHAVEELRRLVTDSTTKTASKLEKADILDLTVKFVKDCVSGQRTQLQQQHASPHSMSNMQMFIHGHIACEMALRKLLDQVMPKQIDNSPSAQQPIPQLINHMLKELSTHRQQLVCRPNPPNLRCSNSAFSPVMTMSSSHTSSTSSTSSSSSSVHRMVFASPSGNSSASTDSFPDLSPTQFAHLNAGGLMPDHRLGFPVHNSTPVRTCLASRNPVSLPAVENIRSSDDMPNRPVVSSPPQPSISSGMVTTTTTNLWRPW